jgi:folate-binding protein YgfZ
MDRTVLARIERDVVVVSGPDATTFLQSLLSQDIEPVAVGESTHALLLEPRGKLVVDMRLVRVADTEWWCSCEAGFGSVLATGLQRFKIRVKVEIEDRSASLRAVAVRGPDSLRLAADAEAVVARVDWPNGPGVEAVGSVDGIDAFAARLVAAGVSEISDDGYEALRVEAGAPRQGYDIDETTIAQEAYLERDAVSFTKGCFLGQELVCRIDTRGHVNRALRRLHADRPMTRGASVVADGKDVGTVTSAAGTVALAMMRSQVEPGSTVAAGDVTAIVEAVGAPGAS